MYRLKRHQGFPAYHDVLQFRAVHGQGELTPYLGRQVRDHDMMLIDDLCQRRQIQLLLFGYHHHPGAYRKGRIHIRQRTVETVAVVTGNAEFLRGCKIAPVPGCIGHDVFLQQPDPFGYAGGTGCVYQHKQVLRLGE